MQLLLVRLIGVRNLDRASTCQNTIASRAATYIFKRSADHLIELSIHQLTFQYVSGSKSRYTIFEAGQNTSNVARLPYSPCTPPYFHNCLLAVLPALTMSHNMGRANSFIGELDFNALCRRGMMPFVAASSCRVLLNRHKLKTVWKTCEQISWKLKELATSIYSHISSAYIGSASSEVLIQDLDQHCYGIRIL
jgi:hypothetical protein